MITIVIPGTKIIELQHLVCDFSGTLSVDGALIPGVEERIAQIAEQLTVHVLTADTHGKAAGALAKVRAEISILDGETHTALKADYVRELGARQVIAFGNGTNDVEMLSVAEIGVAVCLAEGCATAALSAADLWVTSITDGLDLLLHPKRLVAGLRR
jgi:soluble P-type ATPase